MCSQVCGQAQQGLGFSHDVWGRSWEDSESEGGWNPWKALSLA